MTQSTPPASGGGNSEFLESFRDHVQRGDWVKLVLSKCRGSLAEVQRVEMRPVLVRQAHMLSVLFRYPNRDDTQNVTWPEAESWLTARLGVEVFAANLLLTQGSVEGLWSRKGSETVRQVGGVRRDAVSLQHNREKRRFVDPRSPWLRPLGLVDSSHRVLPTMAHKWKQINKFVEVVEGALKDWAPLSPVRALDFGAGKGYLTFALYGVLTGQMGLEAQVVRVELRPELVALGNQTASRLRYDGLRFEVGQLSERAAQEVDLLIALHACDVATDMALRMGVQGNARLIICSPCCHKEVRPQMRAPAELAAVMRYGVQLGALSEMVTDTLRALLLEAHGYSVQVFEFIAMEHTDKNRMLLAVRGGVTQRRREKAAQEYLALKQWFGIVHQHLESTLGLPADVKPEG